MRLSRQGVIVTVLGIISHLLEHVLQNNSSFSVSGVTITVKMVTTEVPLQVGNKEGRNGRLTTSSKIWLSVELLLCFFSQFQVFF